MAPVYLPKELYEELKRRFPKQTAAAPGRSVWDKRLTMEVGDFPRRVVAMGDSRELRVETRPQLCIVSLRALPHDLRFKSELPLPVEVLISRFLYARDVLAALLADDGAFRRELPEDWNKGLENASSLRLFFSEAPPAAAPSGAAASSLPSPSSSSFSPSATPPTEELLVGDKTLDGVGGDNFVTYLGIEIQGVEGAWPRGSTCEAALAARAAFMADAEWREGLAPGSRLDALDAGGVWREAKVLQSIAPSPTAHGVKLDLPR